MMISNLENIEVKFARDEDDIKGCLRLRHRVFVEELGAKADAQSQKEQFETDYFDPFCHHVALVAPEISAQTYEHVVGGCRLLTEEQARKAGRFYSETEFDISALKNSGARLLELGRSCVRAEYRQKNAARRVWLALVEFVNDNHIEFLFGTTSFHGTDIDAIRPALAYLHHHHKAPPEICAKAIGENAIMREDYANTKFNPEAVFASLPSMLKTYLKLGGVIGDGVWVDHNFNTIDVFVSLDVENMLR